MAGKKIGEAFIRVRPDTKGFGPEFKSNAEASGTEVGESFARKLVARVAEVFAAEKVLEFLKGSVERAEESEKLARLTEAVVKSTGGAAHVTADQVAELSTRLSGLSGVDDELIRHGENVLLTFTQIRNAAGKGNDIFDQASEATLNLSVALKQDLQSSAILVGKALNDPVKGVTALRRAGVQLTEQQTEQVKHFVKIGDVMSAQKIILGELKTEFGGAAEAAATPAAKAKVAWENFQEQIGGLLLPVIGKLADLFTLKLLPAIQDIVGWITLGWIDGATKGAGAAQQFGAIAHRVFNELWDIISHYLWPALKTIVVTLHDLIGWINQGSSGAQVFRAIALGLIAAFVAWKVAVTAIEVATKAWAVAQAILDAAMDANPIGLIILAVIALVVAILYLWTHSAAFRDFFIGLWHGIVVAAKAVADFFTKDIPAAWSFLYEHAVKIWQAISDYVVERWRVIMSYVDLVIRFFTVGIPAAWHQLIDDARDVFAAIGGWITTHFDRAVAFISGIPGRILGFFKGLPGEFVSIGRNIIDSLINGAGQLLSRLGSFFLDKLPGWLVGPFKAALGIHSPSTLFAGFGRAIVDGLTGGLEDGASGNASRAARALSSLPGMAANALAPNVSPAAGGDDDVIALLEKIADLLASLRLTAGPQGIALAARAGEKQLAYAGGAR